MQTVVKSRSAFRETIFQWTIENLDNIAKNTKAPIRTYFQLDGTEKRFYFSHNGKDIVVIESEDCPELNNCLIDLYTLDKKNVRHFPKCIPYSSDQKKFYEYKIRHQERNENGDADFYFAIKYISTTFTKAKDSVYAPSAPEITELDEDDASATSTFRKRINGMENLKKMFENQELCDMTFKVGYDEIKAHTVILAAASPYFEAMFKHENTIESMKHLVDLSEDTDVTLGNLRGFLDYLYGCKSVSELSDLAHELLVLSDKFDVRELKGACEFYLGSKLSGDNVATLLISADQYNCQKLKENALSFARAHKDAVKSSRAFEELCKYPNLIVDLLW